MAERYSLSYDIHTHTAYSHGKGTILDNVAAADRAGLRTIGISDHGPGHFLFGMRMEHIAQMRHDIAAAEGLYPGIGILLGAEANICNLSGVLDISADQIRLFDYIIAGYHFGVFGQEPVRSLGVMAGGYIHNLTGRSSVRARNHNTDMVVASLHANPVRVLTHPGDKIAVDIDAVAKACEETGTLMEINRRHNGLSVESIQTAMKYDVRFIIGSDAHRPSDVGNCVNAVARANAASLDLSRIVNLVDK